MGAVNAPCPRQFTFRLRTTLSHGPVCAPNVYLYEYLLLPSPQSLALSYHKFCIESQSAMKLTLNYSKMFTALFILSAVLFTMGHLAKREHVKAEQAHQYCK